MNHTSIEPLSTCRFEDWAFNHSQNTLVHLPSGQSQRLEPKVSDLLWVLICAEGDVVSKDHLLATLWPDVIVGEDTLARTISRLRAALSDSASQPRYVETIPKRGYRMMILAEPVDPPGRQTHLTKHSRWYLGALFCFVVTAVLGASYWLGPLSLKEDLTSSATLEKLARADGLYMQFEKHSNEAALALYQEVIEDQYDNSRAQAGVANALVQRVIRWPEPPFSLADSSVSLTSALQSGQLRTSEAKLMLERARLVAEKAVRQSPNDVDALKSLGLVYSAEGKVDQAIEQYQRAIEINPGAWRSMINLGELLQLQGQIEASLQMNIQTYAAMQARFAQEPQHIGPWQPEMGKLIARKYQESSDHLNAILWARKVLDLVPFDRDTSTILVDSLLGLGEVKEATRYCESYTIKLQPVEPCARLTGSIETVESSQEPKNG